MDDEAASSGGLGLAIELDEDDIDALCLFEEVEEPSQQRRLLHGLAQIELDESQIVDFLRLIGQKLASNNMEKAFAASQMLSALCTNLWTRHIITMFSSSLVKQFLELIPKVRILNWNASMNRSIADALYHLSRYCASMQCSTAHYIMVECQRLLYTQNLTVCGQTLILEIFIRFGVPYIFELDISKLHAVIGLGPEFHFYISARNSRTSPRCHAEPKARRAYLDFGNTWFSFLSIYYYRALSISGAPNDDSIVVGRKRKFQNNDSPIVLPDDESSTTTIDIGNESTKQPLYCFANTVRLIDLKFLHSISQSEQFPPLCLPLEKICSAWFPTTNINNNSKPSIVRNPNAVANESSQKDSSSKKTGSMMSASLLNSVIRQLNAGICVDFDKTFGVPTYARNLDDDDDETLTIDTTQQQQQPSEEDAELKVARREEVIVWVNELFEKNAEASQRPKLTDLFDIEEDVFGEQMETVISCPSSERRYLEVLKLYGSKTTNWRRQTYPNRSEAQSSLICLSECIL